MEKPSQLQEFLMSAPDLMAICNAMRNTYPLQEPEADIPLPDHLQAETMLPVQTEVVREVQVVRQNPHQREAPEVYRVLRVQAEVLADLV